MHGQQQGAWQGHGNTQTRVQAGDGLCRDASRVPSACTREEAALAGMSEERRRLQRWTCATGRAVWRHSACLGVSA